MEMGQSDDMDQLYAGEQQDEAAPAAGKGESVDEEKGEQMGKTGIVPIAMLQGPKGEPVKVGDEIVVKVTAVEGDQAIIAYAPEKPGGDTETPEEESSPDEEIDSINEGY